MIGITAGINNHQIFIQKNRHKKLPNAIIVFFLILQFFYGFNFGFINVLNGKIRRFCKFINVLICLYTSVILLLPTLVFESEWDVKIFWVSLVFAQYCGHIFFLYFSKYTVHNFITDILSIDDGIIYFQEQKIGWLACFVFGSMSLISITSSAVFCIVTHSGCVLNNSYANAIYMLPLTGLDAIVIVQLLVNLYTYYAVMYLVGLVRTEKNSLIRKQFLRVSECCEKFGRQYGNLVVMELVLHLLKYLLLLCNFIYNFKENVMWRTFLIRLSYTIYILFQMCAPAVSVEVVNKEIENLRVKLYARLLKENNVEKHLKLASLLRYMKEKPLYSKAWRVIPADINLVVALFSFITTYVIVIIQFMHIY